MAFTATKGETTLFGNQRVWQGVVSADAASGVVSFALGNLAHVQWAPKSMATVGIRVRLNQLAGTTASVGDLGLSGCASGDDLYVVVFGR